MNQYIIELTRNIGIGKDIINFFTNRGYKVVWEDRDAMPKTLIIESSHHCIEDIKNLKYVSDVKEVRTGSIFV
ncbi:hypothetical protein AF332_11445 [Sporosarcina globispora]|uniref:Uncharacterized protein n=1 Tax=Sporosarcina globispora TaxID=1459 RepID=A0A0M0GC81_SPOGL|nr:hypothetical protein [Sporosarcina globispora]KON87378.1 hypothetical protein AF332_11445 [Sporosarcina globispora]